ncbi:MAG: UDP-glucose dehydrogenase family protein [Bacteroidota bacterium]
MKISVIGTGYVGLVAGTCLAESGNDVMCVDIDRAKVRMLQRGVATIYEPGLTEMMTVNIREERLKFTTNLENAVTRSEIIFLALPTPQSEDGSADLRHVLEASKQIGKYFNGYKVIVNKSTVPVGTADRVRDIVKNETDVEFDVVSNPEFLKEGNAINDFMKPDRIVIGSSSDRATEIMRQIYAPFVRTGNPIIIMDVRSSELTKYAANSFLAAKISFMNEIANLCERVGANADFVRKGIGSDPRIGSQFLFPGVGYGGSCFPKDVAALEKTSKDFRYDFRILNAVQRVNENQPNLFINKIEKYFKGKLKGKLIAVWGLAFKPKTDDLREAPSIKIIEGLLKKGAKVHVHDPIALHEAKKRLGDRVVYHTSNYGALKGVSALVVVTEWNEFRTPDFNRMKSLMKEKVIFDGRNIYDPKIFKALGFEYFSVGR